MGESSIEWTDVTWNPTRGCTKISPGCKHCYAETFAERFRGVKGHPYEQGFDLRLVPKKLTEPLTWKEPRRVFVNSMSDLFHDDVPFTYVAAVFGVMAACTQHTFQILTKRPERMLAFFEWLQQEATNFRIVLGRAAVEDMPKWTTEVLFTCAFQENVRPSGLLEYRMGKKSWPLPNVHLGVSVESQKYANERSWFLFQCPAAAYFFSMEPLLEAVDLTMIEKDGMPWNALTGAWWIDKNSPNYNAKLREKFRRDPRLSWVIVGGESGNGARLFDVNWALDIVKQCQDAGVPVFVKQLGRQPANGLVKLHLASKKGNDMSEWPDGLRVREWPKS